MKEKLIILSGGSKIPVSIEPEEVPPEQNPLPCQGKGGYDLCVPP